MNTALDLAGQRFTRLVVIAPSNKRGYWQCICDCGKHHETLGYRLQKCLTRSCGCLHREQLGALRRTHGASDSLTWKRWRSMRARCEMPNTKSYPAYGGRGIAVCERWKQDYENFLMDMGECPSEKFTIDRIDNNLGYSPGNCRWATKLEQARNQSSNHLLTFNGKTLCITEWAEETGINNRTLRTRLRKGWSIEQTLTTPPKPRSKRS